MRRLAQLPILPLPEAQLFPYAVLPLHVGESRYCDLLQDCLASDRVFGIASIAPGHDNEEARHPPVLRVCGVGQVIAHETTKDGACNILVYGMLRVRIVGELEDDKPYRRVRAEPLADEYPMGVDLAAAQHAMTALTERLAARLPTGGDMLRALAHAHTEPGALSDVLAAALVMDPAARQALLENTNVAARIEVVSQAIALAVDRFDSTRLMN